MQLMAWKRLRTDSAMLVEVQGSEVLGKEPDLAHRQVLVQALQALVGAHLKVQGQAPVQALMQMATEPMRSHCQNPAVEAHWLVRLQPLQQAL